MLQSSTQSSRVVVEVLDPIQVSRVRYFNHNTACLRPGPLPKICRSWPDYSFIEDCSGRTRRPGRPPGGPIPLSNIQELLLYYIVTSIRLSEAAAADS